MKAALLSDGRGANIQNVNQQALSNLRIPIPPLALQTRFADFARAADKSKFVAWKAAKTAAQTALCSVGI
jgi:type I restriction enzyme S subunit